MADKLTTEEWIARFDPPPIKSWSMFLERFDNARSTSVDRMCETLMGISEDQVVMPCRGISCSSCPFKDDTSALKHIDVAIGVIEERLKRGKKDE